MNCLGRNKRDRDFTECSLGSEGEVGKERRRLEGEGSEALTYIEKQT